MSEKEPTFREQVEAKLREEGLADLITGTRKGVQDFWEQVNALAVANTQVAIDRAGRVLENAIQPIATGVDPETQKQIQRGWGEALNLKYMVDPPGR